MYLTAIRYRSNIQSQNAKLTTIRLSDGPIGQLDPTKGSILMWAPWVTLSSMRRGGRRAQRGPPSARRRGMSGAHELVGPSGRASFGHRRRHPGWEAVEVGRCSPLLQIGRFSSSAR